MDVRNIAKLKNMKNKIKTESQRINYRADSSSDLIQSSSFLMNNSKQTRL